MRGLAGAARKKAMRPRARQCFLDNVLHQSVDTLSKGYRHRTCFAQSIIHDPPTCWFWTSRPTASIRTRSTRCAA
jgi:ABC-type Na+ transport system ATPase subunit NatA